MAAGAAVGVAALFACGPCAEKKGGTRTDVALASRAAPADGRPESLVIMPLGDSITGEAHAYREPLYELLTGAGCPTRFVGSQYDPRASIPERNHEGHSGWTVQDIARGVGAWLADARPDYVLLLIGTNDLAWSCAETGAQVAERHAALMDAILDGLPTAWLVVGSIPPESPSIVDSAGADRAQLTVDFNAAMKRHIESRMAQGKRVRYADVSGALTLSDLRDGIHPTERGYLQVAQAWSRALEPIAKCLGGSR